MTYNELNNKLCDGIILSVIPKDHSHWINNTKQLHIYMERASHPVKANKCQRVEGRKRDCYKSVA